MPDSQLQYDDLIKSVAFYLGWGRTAYASLSSDQQDRADLYVQSGYRNFLFASLNERGVIHEWSFLKPVTSITLWPTISATASDITSLTYSDPDTTIVMESTWSSAFYASMVGKSVAFDSNSYTITEYVSATSVKVSGDASSETSGFTITANGAYRLPSNFGGIHGTELTFDESDDYYPGVTLVDEFFVRRLRQQAEASGRPTHAAVRPVESDQSVKQKFELVVYPDVSTVYTLQYATNAYPEELSTSNPYPLGGPQHSEVIKACALAEAEKHERDGFMNWQSEARRLTVAAIKADARLLAAKSLGYNGNMRKIGSLSHRAFRNHIVTVQGEIPGES